jgi:hypothetical protein
VLFLLIAIFTIINRKEEKRESALCEIEYQSIKNQKYDENRSEVKCKKFVSYIFTSRERGLHL